MKVVILNKADLSVVSTYDADAPNQSKYGGPWGDPSQTIHVGIPEGVDARAAQFALEEDGSVGITEDAVKKAALVKEDAMKSIQAAITKATAFGSSLINEFAAENVMLGITQDGKTGEVLDKMDPIISALQSGSLYEAIKRAKAIPTSKYDSKYVTHDRIYAFVNKIEAYLGLQLSQ